VEITPGDKVRDTITDLEGTAMARTVWLNGCVRIAVQPRKLKDGVPVEAVWVDEPQLELVEARISQRKPEPTHGPRPDPSRAADPQR
jgi:hypothetical protein